MCGFLHKTLTGAQSVRAAPRLRGSEGYSRMIDAVVVQLRFADPGLGVVHAKLDRCSSEKGQRKGYAPPHRSLSIHRCRSLRRTSHCEQRCSEPCRRVAGSRTGSQHDRRFAPEDWSCSLDGSSRICGPAVDAPIDIAFPARRSRRATTRMSQWSKGRVRQIPLGGTSAQGDTMPVGGAL
jgi:hypothetical protein